MNLPEKFLLLFAAGSAGALIKDLLSDGCLELPKKLDGKIYLGFISGIIIGGFAGYLIDGSFITAFLGGCSGSMIISGLITKAEAKTITENTEKEQEKKTEINNKAISKEEVEKLIRAIAHTNSVDEELAVKVAKCESGLNCNAVNTNKDGSRDRGLYQWNEKWHPEIYDECAFDPTCATKKFCEAVRAGNLKWWDASKKCWG